MGTVPDPEGSAKASVVASAEETDCLIDQQPPNHQHEQTVVGKNGNGVLIPEPKTVALCSFNLNCSTLIETPRSEQPFELSKLSKHGLCHTLTSSPSSPAEKVLLADAEPLSSCDPPHYCAPAELELAVDRSMVQLTDIQPSTDTAMPTLQSIPLPPNSLPQPDNSIVNMCRTANNNMCIENVHQNGESIIMDEGTQNWFTQSNAVLGEQTEKPTVEGISTPASLHSAILVTDCDVSRLPTVVPVMVNCHINLETRERDITDALSCHMTDPTQGLETSLQSSISDHQLVKTTVKKETEADLQSSSKFKDMGTMTIESKSCSSHDAEVQAVAHMESKSVSTSPSILAAYLRENQFQKKDREDQVCIIYRGNTRPGHPDLSLNPVVTPKVRFRATAMEVLNPAYLKLHGRPGLSSEGACKISSNLTKVAYQRPEVSSHNLAMYKSESEAQAMCAARDSRGLPQLPLAPQGLLNVKPAYQINIDANNQNKQCQRPMEIKTQPPHFMAGKEMNKRSGHHLVGVTEDNQLRGNRAIDYDKPDSFSVPADGGGDRKPFHFKITNELGTTQAIITTDIIKPKKEDKPSFLNFDGDITSNIGAAGGQVEEFLQVFIKKEKDKLQEENEQAKRSSGLSIQSRSSSDFSHNNSPHTPRLKKAREEKKEQKLATSATSDQSKLHPGKKLNEAGSKTEEKSKESKSVKDVVWDEQGMTWEVYGASMDPESLGIAIQNHLTRQIREHEKLIRAQMKQNRKSISSETSSKKLKGRQNNVLHSIFQNFRRPNCCAHPPPSSVLD